MALLLSDAGLHAQLLPLTFTRPLGAMRPGVLTLADAWWRMTEIPVGFRTQGYLSERYPSISDADLVREVRGSLLPLPDLVAAVLDLTPGQVLVKDGVVLAFCHEPGSAPSELDWVSPPAFLDRVTFGGDLVRYERPWDLFRHCHEALINDLALLTEGRRSAAVSALNTVIGDPSLVFLEEGARVEAAVLNTTHGPIYVDRDAEIMEGCLVRGPFALGRGSQLKMGAKVYGPTAIGPGCRIGGEVNNSVVFGHCNKAHDGFLGNSVLGEWCNLGADTNNSNLKNTYGEVKAWSYAERRMIGTDQQFCGLIMGDHSKTGINTMLNTGTVIGVCANVFGSGFPPKHVPSFTWGGADGLVEHELSGALTVAERVMARRHASLDPATRAILAHVRDATVVDRAAT
ncbi:MAG: GlmU family protein [Flavobacteriales bacterium]|nr:GlmU family protein [Flavobacteriales bacterium]MCB9194199.1 GlmU family protein [Flavobacteriales bacterium]